MIGASPAIRAVRDQIERLLRTGRTRLPPTLILGETGTGKGLLARAIHDASARQSGPFVSVNCAAIPEALLESELFGFERGAFTDARQSKRGLFQTAHGGTLFLDEIGALSVSLQAKLLTAVDERAVRRLGGLHSEPVDVWIIAATNDQLLTAVRQRRFREDLYHRIAAMTLTMPPLRERGADILRLADHFLVETCRDYGLPMKHLSPDARAALLGYPWPGNVRELANTMERVALLGDDNAIPAGALGLAVECRESAQTPVRHSSPSLLQDLVDDFERSQILAALEATAWNTSRAAAQLGLARNTLRYRMKKLRLQLPRSRLNGAGAWNMARAHDDGPQSPQAEPPVSSVVVSASPVATSAGISKALAVDRSPLRHRAYRWPTGADLVRGPRHDPANAFGRAKDT
jgi:transcriptional regulator with PAS, ATPase and Fis domain